MGRTRIIRSGVAVVGLTMALAVLLAARPAVAARGTTSSRLSATSSQYLVPSACKRDTASDNRYVLYAYNVIFRRNAQPPEARFWVNSFAYPYSLTATAFADSLLASSEYRSLVVRSLYPPIMHRNIDPDGLSYWSNWMAHATAADLAGVLLASDENWSRSGATPEGWVAQLYQDALHRSADAAGVTYWVGQLNSGRFSRRQIARAFWQSVENRQARVVEMFHIFFERAVDASGLRYWTNELLHHSDAWMAKRLLLGDEGWRRAQVVYGGRSTPMPPPCPKPLSVWPPSPRTIFSLGDYPAGGRLISLTFDDGPNPIWTSQILDVLASRGVKATFFVVGEYAQMYPDLIRRELAEGHRVGSHTWTHADLTRLSITDARNQIQSTVNLVNSIAGGKAVSCVRPPYGSHNATTDQIGRDLGLSTVIWSRDSQDYQRPGVPAIIANSLSTTYDGGRGIDGMHDGGGDRSQTVAALGPLIDNLRAQGYRFVTIC